MPRGDIIDQALVDEILGGDPLMTPGEVCRALGIDHYRLRRLVTTGRIPAIQVHGFTHRRFRTSVIEQAVRDGVR